MNTELKKYRQPIIVGVLFAILIAILVWFVIDLRQLHRQGDFRMNNPLYRHRHNASNPLMLSAQIQSWMTFRYINYVFRLPVNYLSDKLNITDKSYPNITLDKYITTHKADRAAFIESVKQAVAAYYSGGSK